MTRNRMLLTLSLCALFTVSLLVGCGGGGGGGDASPVTPTGGGFTPTGSLGAAPTGFSSAGFPATTAALTVNNFTAGQRAAVILANNSTSVLSVGTTAALGAPVARIVPDQDESLANVAGSRNLGVPAPGSLLFGRLRDFERRLPRPSLNAQQSQKRNIRPDVVGSDVGFKVYPSGSIVTARCQRILSVGGGVNVNFFLDTSLLNNTTASDWINTFYSSFPAIYSTVHEIFGNEPPADYNALGTDITILLSNQIADDELVAGFFYSGDLYPANQIEGGISNQRKMFYLNFSPTLSTTTMVSTLAHEFQHMVNFYQRKIRDLSEDDWLNEAMSGYAEHVCGFKISTSNGSKCAQVLNFLTDIRTVPLTRVPWPGTDATYGQVYLFGTWLGQKFGGTTGVVKTLLSSSKTGVAAVAEFAGEDFDKVFARFVTALYANDTTGGSYYGFKDIDLKALYTFSDFSPVQLSGPTLISNSGFPYQSGTIIIDPYSAAYVELSGGNGGTLSIGVPTNLTVLQLTK